MDKNIPAGAVVMSSYASGVYIPGLTGCKVYAGHYDQTINSPRKQREAGYFFESGAPEDFRHNLLSASRTDYVYYGGFEREIGNPGFDSSSEFSKIYDNGNAAVYKINR